MKRNQKDEALPRHVKPDERITETNEAVERDPLKSPVQPPEVEPRPAERPDLDWVEHED